MPWFDPNGAEHSDLLPGVGPTATLIGEMLVRTVAVKWELHQDLSVEEFFGELAKEAHEKFDFDERPRLLLIGKSQGFHVAMLVTEKDQGGICDLIEHGGQYSFDFRELEKDRKLMDFNFLVMNPNTKRGLYTHYHHSCSPNVFGVLIRRRYAKLVYGDDPAARGLFRQQLLMSEKGFIDLVRELKSIGNLEFDLGVATPKKGVYRHFRGVAKTVRHAITYERKTGFDERVDSVLSLLGSGDAEEVIVKGRDMSGYYRTVRLTDNPEVFDERDFDDLAREVGEFTADGFAKSAIIKRLIRIAKTDPLVLAKAS